MNPRFLSVLVFLVALMGSSLIFAQSQSAAEVGSNTRQQDADARFADAERALTIRLLDKALTQADADSALLTEAVSTMNGLNNRLASLKTNDDGKRLASALDDISAGELQRLIDAPPLTLGELDSLKKEIDSATNELKKLRADPPAGFSLPDQQQDELFQISISLRQMVAHVRERGGWLTSMIASAPKDLNLQKSPTLGAVLGDFRSREQRDWNDAQKKGIEDAKPEALNQITDAARMAELERSLQQSRAMLEEARADIERSKIDLEMQLRILNEEKQKEVALLNQRLAESEAHRAVQNAQADATREGGKEDAQRIALRQKCQSPEVKQILAPFISVGLWQPGDTVGKPWIHDRGPVSLSALTATGALEPSSRGLTLLYIYGNGRYINTSGYQHPDTERPKWGYNPVPSRLSQSDWQEIKHAQDLLRELGPTLVDLGMMGK